MCPGDISRYIQQLIFQILAGKFASEESVKTWLYNNKRDLMTTLTPALPGELHQQGLEVDKLLQPLSDMVKKLQETERMQKERHDSEQIQNERDQQRQELEAQILAMYACHEDQITSSKKENEEHLLKVDTLTQRVQELKRQAERYCNQVCVNLFFEAFFVNGD